MLLRRKDAPAPRQNNFDALRLLAAISVIFSHSFLIAEGTQNNEPLILLTGNQSILGLAGVFVFFAISGFLVTQSFEQTTNPLHFLAKRALRIFPGLFMATLVSAFVLGPLVTDLPLGAYLSRPEPYEYVVGNTLLDQTVQELPGVWFVGNAVGLEVNGSLWTLRSEFLMYLMVLVLGMLRLLTLRVTLVLLAFGMACLHFNVLDELEGWGLDLPAAQRLGLARRLLCRRHGPLQAAPHPHLRWPYRAPGACRPWPQHAPAPVHLAVSAVRLLSGPLARHQPYGWPVEEAAMWFSGGRASWWQVFLIALPATAAIAFLSWHLVERPMLRLKPGSWRAAARYAPAAQQI